MCGEQVLGGRTVPTCQGLRPGRNPSPSATQLCVCSCLILPQILWRKARVRTLSITCRVMRCGDNPHLHICQLTSGLAEPAGNLILAPSGHSHPSRAGLPMAMAKVIPSRGNRTPVLARVPTEPVDLEYPNKPIRLQKCRLQSLDRCPTRRLDFRISD
jgi:hypothetical protein